MRTKLRQLAINLALMAVSLALTLAFLEFVVFGHLFRPDDVLPNVSINGVVRYMPNTRAVFRHPDGSETVATINAQGWNSTRRAYAEARTPGVRRVAVIGDSYVHGSFINPDQGFPEVIERQLNAAGVKAEVLRFGMDGAPMSQYLHMLRREVARFQPDLVVVLLIHNDFDETYRFLKTRYASSFLKVGVDDAGRPKEIAPAPFASGPADLLREFATFRYLYYKTNAYLHLKRFVSRFWWGGDEDYAPEFIQSAVDIRKIRDEAKNRFFARYVLQQMQTLAADKGIKLAIVMDGVRDAIYSGAPLASYEVAKLNGIAKDATTELGLPFLDLQTTFATDFAQNRRRFEFAYDWHWNVLGNRLAGEAITRFLLSDRRLLGQPTATSAEAAGRPKG